MAQAQNLPIYRRTSEFIIAYIKVYENMRNLHKYRMGAYIYDNLVRLPWFVKKANRYVDERRQTYIEDYLDELENIGNALRICHDTRMIDSRAHARLAEYVVELGKQANAWKRCRAGLSVGTPSDRDAVIKGCPVETREGPT